MDWNLFFESFTNNSWLVLGIIIILAEFVVPGFILFFFGVGAILVNILSTYVEMPLWLEILLFLLFSVSFLFFLRERFYRVFHGGDSHDNTLDEGEYVGKMCVALSNIDKGKEGEVEFRGSNWKAKALESIKKGDELVIEARENITLIVKKIDIKE